MCYGTCEFENHMGDCTVNPIFYKNDIKGYNICFLGGHFECEEDERYYNNNFGEIQLARDYYYKNEHELYVYLMKLKQNKFLINLI